MKGLHLLYPDPELTKEGIELCEERRDDLVKIVDSYFPGHSYTVGTSSMIRTQQTAYHMLLKGTHDAKYAIFPHIAEEGFMMNDFPLPAKQQHAVLGPSVIGHLDKDLRGSTNYYNKSNWPLFVKWIQHEGKDHLFKTEKGTEEGVYRAVIFTHGKFIRHALEQPKAHNNDIFYVRLDAETGTQLETKKLTDFPEPSSAVEGCRIQTKIQYLTGGTRKSRRQNRTQNRRTQNRRQNRTTRRKRI